MIKKPIKKSSARGKTPIPIEYFKRPVESKWETEEFGPGQQNIVICGDCGIAYYGKAWHHNLRNYKNVERAKRVAFKLCPACMMAKNKQYEGEIRISDLPKNKVNEITGLVRVLARKAYELDPLDRILRTKYSGNTLSVQMSENQLAQRLAKKLKDTMKKSFSKPEICKGKGEDPFVIKMNWLGKR